jgi:hypothetical protein
MSQPCLLVALWLMSGIVPAAGYGFGKERGVGR